MKGVPHPRVVLPGKRFSWFQAILAARALYASTDTPCCSGTHDIRCQIPLDAPTSRVGQIGKEWECPVLRAWNPAWGRSRRGTPPKAGVIRTSATMAQCLPGSTSLPRGEHLGCHLQGGTLGGKTLRAIRGPLELRGACGCRRGPDGERLIHGVPVDHHLRELYCYRLANRRGTQRSPSTNIRSLLIALAIPGAR